MKIIMFYKFYYLLEDLDTVIISCYNIMFYANYVSGL